MDADHHCSNAETSDGSEDESREDKEKRVSIVKCDIFFFFFFFFSFKSYIATAVCIHPLYIRKGIISSAVSYIVIQIFQCM